MSNHVADYRRVDIEGKSQIDLIVKVYDGAIEAFGAAGRAYEREDFTTGHDQVDRAVKFVTHLFTTLDMERGGEVAMSLSQLYVYVITQANVVRATKDLRLIADNVTILQNLRQGWLDLRDSQSGAPGPERQSAVPTGGFNASA